MGNTKLLESLDYSHKGKIPNDLLWSRFIDQPIILPEKGCPLQLISAGVNHKNDFILSLSFQVRVNDAFGSPVVKNIHVSAHGASKEKIVATETLFIETLFDSSCSITVNEMSNKSQIIEKKLRINDNIEVSGTLLNKASGLSLKNKEFFIVVSEWKRNDRTLYGRTQSCLTDDCGHFKAKILKSELGWELGLFQLSFYIKSLTNLLLEYDDQEDNHHRFKSALVTAIQVEDKTILQDSIKREEESNSNKNETLAEIKKLLEEINVSDWSECF
jgi:hypothetical protein